MSTTSESSPSQSPTQPQIIIIKTGYTDSQARACHRYYERNKAMICEKNKARYHAKKLLAGNKDTSPTVSPIVDAPIHTLSQQQPAQEI